MVTVNGALFGHEEFHNGEVIYKSVTLSNVENTIELRFENNKDIANLIFASHYVRDKQPDASLNLKMLYIPYSRMDREIPEGNQIFSMKYFAEIINDIHFDNVIVLDPHSEVSENLLNNLFKVDLTKYVRKAIELFKPDYIIYPDKGAFAKYPVILKEIEVPHFHANKKRDLADKGHIIEAAYELVDAPDLTGKSVLIVDDLISLGGTAFITGKTLKEAGADRVGLYVSHTENGVFVGKLLDGDAEGYMAVDKVYTAATTPLVKEHENLVIVEA